VLHLIGLEDKPNSSAAHLSHGQKQWLKIGMVVISDADLLLLGRARRRHVTGGSDTNRAELIRRLTDWHSLLVIDHDMAFIAQLDAPVTVLQTGQLLRMGTLEEIRNDPQVAAVYLGRPQESGHAQA
jgi:urea transport system ATP-binding protein